MLKSINKKTKLQHVKINKTQKRKKKNNNNNNNNSMIFD